MDLKIVQDLLALMQEGELTELHIVDGETEIRLSRQPESGPAPVAYAQAPVAAALAPAAAAPVAAVAPVAEEPPGEMFRSPMVGTYYSKPDPDSPGYVAVGDSVGGESVLCILEAMKVFNEIKAEFNGTILEILVKDGEAVEYDQPLFRIQTS